MAKKSDNSAKIPEEVRPVFDEIAKLVSDFCKKHLNGEYADLCCKLTEKSLPASAHQPLL